MSILGALQWLGTSAVANAMNGPEWAFPMVESLHFIGFALSIGTIAIIDLRLMGWGMRREPAGQIAAGLAPWTIAGIALMLITGPLMFSADPMQYYFNVSFRFKMAFLAAALVSHAIIYRKATTSGFSPGFGKIAGLLSLLLWTGVVAGGRMIAFV